MLKTILPILALLAAMAPWARGNDIEPGKQTYTVVPAPKPIVLDGSLNEWSGVPVLADPKFAVPKYSGTNASPNYVLFEQYAGGTWSGPDDQTSAVQIVYDADNVYFGFVVTDDYHENISGNAWNGDSVQLMIADATRTTQVALYNYALGGYEDNSGKFIETDATIIHHEAGPGGDDACACATEAVVKRDSAAKKTTYEIKLPKAALGLTSLQGVQFGLGMAINDGDGALVDGVQYGQAGQEGQKGWGGLGAHSIVFGKTPSETALVTMPTRNDIEPGKESYTALKTTRNIVIDGNLGDWAGAPVLADPRFAVPKYSGTNASPNYVLFEQYAGGTWSGPDDQTSAVQVVYDDNNVYFGFVVTDDYHQNISGNAWNGDSVQLMIADEERATQVALYNYALGGYEDNQGKFIETDGVIIHHEAGPGGAEDCNCPTEAVVRRDSAAKKTIYEIKLPVAALGLTPPLQVGTKFGLGMAINDGDGALVDGVQYGQAGQEGQKGWGGLGAHAIVFGKTPAETAQVTLGTTVSGSDVFFLSAVTPNILGFSFRATDKGTSIVDPASARLTIDNQTVQLTPRKAGDATDFTYTASTAFQLDTTHTYAIQIKDTVGNTVTDQGTFKLGSFKVGLNFGTDQPESADPIGSALPAEERAGVPAVAQAYWNNLSGPANLETPTVLLSDQGANSHTTISVTWESNNTWSSTGLGEENNQFTGADMTLMTGYLDTEAATTTKVTLTGIPNLLTAGGYDVYVYILGGTGGRGGGYRIVDTNGTVLKPYVLANSMTNPSGYKEVPQGAGRAEGNYIVFKGLKASDIVVEATTAAPQGAGNPARAPLNAIQIVPSAPTAVPGFSTVAKNGNNLVLAWSGGTLESADAVTGPWTAVANAASPATIPISGVRKFYRVR
jgi:hypothetical protein